MIKNIAAYRFLHLTDLLTWQSLFQSNPLTQALKGTIVLSAEGINLMLAGEEEAIDASKD